MGAAAARGGTPDDRGRRAHRPPSGVVRQHPGPPSASGRLDRAGPADRLAGDPLRRRPGPPRPRPPHEDRELTLPSRKGTLGFGIIGGFKLATGLLLAATGFGIFRLVNKDLADVLEHFAVRIHLDPENRLVQDAVSRVSGIDKAQLKALGVGTFFYAALETVEGVGLLLRRHWAEYLTVIATGLLLPLEIYEIVEK